MASPRDRENINFLLRKKSHVMNASAKQPSYIPQPFLTRMLNSDNFLDIQTSLNTHKLPVMQQNNSHLGPWLTLHVTRRPKSSLNVSRCPTVQVWDDM